MSLYRFTAQANLDVTEITEYIFALNPVAANRFLDELDRTCELLSFHSGIGRLRPEIAPDIRSFPVGNYLIFYLPTSDGVDVIRVLYGGRDLPTVFQPD